MLKPLIKTTLTVLLATVVFAATASAQTAGAPSTNAPAASHPKKERLIWTGTLTAVDKTAMTVTIKKSTVEKTFQVTSQTKIHTAAGPATLEDGVIGEEASASYRKAAGTNTVPKALSLRLGSSEKKKSEAPASSDTSTNKVN